MAWEKFESSPRDLVIHRAKIGELTPEEAEAEAERQGFGPMATKPNPVDFDPSRMPDWSLPMALAWIAWRTTDSVREHCADYREKCLLWFPGSWNIPADDGKEFKRIDGYELRPLGRSTAVRLSLVEAYLSSTEKLPPTRQMTIAKAEKEMFVALASGHLVAIGKDDVGKVVDIPQREWPYLQVFEEQESDVLKRDALDATPAFTEIKLWKKDLQRLWAEFLVQPYMIEPMTRLGTAGYVPFCSALHWIMTEGGAVERNLEDGKAWANCVERLLPLVSTGEIEIIGRPGTGPFQRIEHQIFAGIPVSQPTQDSFSMITGDDPWISSMLYVDAEHWNADFNDQLYLSKSGSASWNHLQVKKADVLREIKFEGRNEALEPAAYRSGAPGRPSANNLVKLEFDARCRRVETAPSVKLEAIALADWLGTTHPSAPQLTAKTIENQIRAAFRSRVFNPRN